MTGKYTTGKSTTGKSTNGKGTTLEVAEKLANACSSVEERPFRAA
jgi:hypothetical protein